MGYRPSRNEVTQGYHGGHKAYDFSHRGDQNIYAYEDGEVIQSVGHYKSSWRNTGKLTTRDYGNYLIIRHQNSYTLYAHLDPSFILPVGTRVKKGQVIGKIGNTGNSTGAHLHFELRNSSNVNIEPVFDAERQEMPADDSARKARDLYWNILMSIREKLGLVHEGLKEPQEKEIYSSINELKSIKNSRAQYESLYTKCKQELEEVQKKKDHAPSKMIPEASRESLRTIVAGLVGVVVAWGYQQYPVIGQLEPNQAATVALLTGAIVKGIDRAVHKFGKDTGREQLMRGILRF